MDKNSVPILFLIFNRPDNTKRVFEAIRHQRPRYLYIAADGPRHDQLGENDLCDKTREIATKVDWDCRVKTLFREYNLGCKAAVSGAIDWFFDQVDEGIILEDDCLPDASFFPFCAEMLEKYRADNQVMSVSGSNLLGRPWKSETQSYFWGYGGIWGWATWKRAWDLYDIEMKDWQDEEIKKRIRDAIKTDHWYEFYYPMFESSFNGSLNTWDIQWFYSILINNGLAINPSVNLVKNVGFGAGTHTNSEDNHLTNLPLNALSFPLKHPNHRIVDLEYLELMFNEINGPSKSKNSFLGKIFKFLGKKKLY
jgi:hypothetical protein